MNLFNLAFFGGILILGGCAGQHEGATTASASTEETYVPLGSAIARKGKPAPDQTNDLQQLQNARLNSGTANTGK